MRNSALLPVKNRRAGQKVRTYGLNVEILRASHRSGFIPGRLPLLFLGRDEMGRPAQPRDSPLPTQNDHDVEQAGPDRLAREGRARGVDQKSRLHALLFGITPERGLDLLMGELVEAAQAVREAGQQLFQSL